MKILIAGLGSIGRRHFRNLIALGEKDIIFLRTRRATLADDELAGYPVETDLKETLQKHKPDAVSCQPDLHAPGCGDPRGGGWLPYPAGETGLAFP